MKAQTCPPNIMMPRSPMVLMSSLGTLSVRVMLALCWYGLASVPIAARRPARRSIRIRAWCRACRQSACGPGWSGFAGPAHRHQAEHPCPAQSSPHRRARGTRPFGQVAGSDQRICFMATAGAASADMSIWGVIALGPGLPHAQQQGARSSKTRRSRRACMAITIIPSTGTLRPASYLKLVLQRTECFAKKTLGVTCAPVHSWRSFPPRGLHRRGWAVSTGACRLTSRFGARTECAAEAGSADLDVLTGAIVDHQLDPQACRHRCTKRCRWRRTGHRGCPVPCLRSPW